MHPLLWSVVLYALTGLALGQSDSSASNSPDQTSASPSAAASSASSTAAPSLPASVPDSTTLVPIKIEKATYPDEAQHAGLQGQVIVKILVSEKGDVEAVEVVSGDAILARAAVEAVRKWKFKPFIKGGRPIRTSTQIPFDFAFSDKVTDKVPPSPTTNNASEGTPVRISQGVSQGLLIHKVQPVYPIAARSNHVQGMVLLKAVIGKDGRIAELTPVSGPPELIPSAVGAVQQWRYRPYLLEGKPAQVQTQITVIFKLSP